MSNLLLTNLVKKGLLGNSNSRHYHAVWYGGIIYLILLLCMLPSQGYSAASMTQGAYPNCQNGACTDLVQRNLSLPANSSSWVDTGLSVSTTDKVSINVLGSISIDNILPQPIAAGNTSTFYLNVSSQNTTDTLTHLPFVIVANNNGSDPTYHLCSYTTTPPSQTSCTTTLTVPDIPSSSLSNGYLSPEANGSTAVVSTNSMLTITNNSSSPLNVNILAPQNFTTFASTDNQNPYTNYPSSISSTFTNNTQGYGAIEFQIVQSNTFIVGSANSPACINGTTASSGSVTNCSTTTTVNGTINNPPASGGSGWFPNGSSSGTGTTPPGTGELYLRIRNMNHSPCYFTSAGCTSSADNPIDLSKYFTGNYFVQVSQQTAGSIGNVATWILAPINTETDTAVAQMYEYFVTNVGYIQAVRAALVLYLVIHAIHFTFGMIQDTHRDFIERITKISIILVLISPTSWQFFDTYLYSLFTNGRDELLGYATGNTNPNQGTIFSFLDKSVGMFFLDSTWVKLASLLLEPILGWVIFGIIITCMYWFILVVIEAFLAYIIAVVTLEVLIILGPLFLVLMLFQRTKPMFDAWISALLNFALQPVFIFAALAVLNEILVVLFYQSISFATVPQCILPAPSADSWLTLLLPICIARAPVPLSSSFNPILIFTNSILMLIVVQMIKVFIGMMPQVVGLLTGENFQENVFVNTGLAAKLNDKVKGAKDWATSKGKGKGKGKDKGKEGGSEGGGGGEGGGGDAVSRPGISAPSIPSEID